MEAIALVYAHPYPARSIACRLLADAAATLEGVDVRPIYSLYPDFDIDVAAERAALERAGLVVFLHPLYWYSVPGMLKHYFDVVLTKGWAYGEGGGALAGKSCLWAATTGGDDQAYTGEGRHHHAFADFVAPVEQTMRYCAMHWLDPHIVHGAHDRSQDALVAAAAGFRERLVRWRGDGAVRELLIFLAAAVICVPLAVRFGLGSVLGYLIAGVAVGPWGLGFIANVQATLHLAEFGVVLLLFVIGLELEPKRLSALRKSVFAGGSLQMIACAVPLAIALSFAGMPTATAVIAGVALALSSTAGALQAMQERNELATPTGRSIFAILLFQDIAALPLIAAVPFLAASGPSGESLWTKVGLAVAAITGVLIAGRYLLAPLLRVIARTNLREVSTAFSLLLVIGIAMLMTAAGVSPALGGFLAGVLLASSEYRHALETDIEPFKGLLLGLFFISVGMTVDLGLLAAKPGVVALLVVALLGIKFAALVGVARLLGISQRQCLLFAILLAQGGEFAFVVFAAARLGGLLTQDWASLLTMAVALSMAATPLLLLLHDKFLARSAKATREADTIQTQGPVIIAGFGRFGQIVGRLLIANGVRPVILDHDPDQIELLRNFGYQVYYGDATRLDLLRAAGAAEASLLVNAIDDVDDSVALVDRVRANFPNLRIIARARNVSHYFELRLRGVEVAEREMFEASLRAGRRALEVLGVDPFRARDMANAFRRHNVNLMDSMLPYYRDEQRFMSMAKAGREELEEQFRRDREKFEKEHPEGWK